ncbi:MAG: sulfatase [Verrucomicrobia bacterium]|nr:sulfatase [Verrucomicrobiota bacterium]
MTRLLRIARLLSLAAALTVAGAAPPNLIVILIDDQGYYDLGCYGATEVDTPRIDALARDGIRFTDYYAAAPICSPSRAGLLTGCYPRRVGMETWVQRADSRRGLAPDELTLPRLLKSAGYATACIGKWHLGFAPPFLPRQQGFDHFFGLLHNLDPIETVYFERAGGVPLLRGDEVVQRPANPTELTRRYTDEAIAFLEANRHQPFFLYLPHTMLHEPLGVSEEFRGKSRWGTLGDATQELDHHIGRLIDSLHRLGIAERTVVVYASDNGRGPGRSATQPMRGGKLTTYECGLRVPAIAWGPGAGIRRGYVSPTLIHAMDWLPTLASLAGVPVPAGRILDGRDLAPLLQGRVDTIPSPSAQLSLNAAVPLRRAWDPPGEWASLFTRDEYLNAFFYHGAEGQLAAVRAGNWKLALSPAPQLFDLSTDPGESKPARAPAVLRKLRGMAVLFQEEMSREARRAAFAPSASEAR